MLIAANPEDQISQSRRVLAAWDRMSTMSGRPDEVVRLLQGETRALAALAIAHPSNAPAAAQLIAAYSRLAASVGSQHRPTATERA